MTRYLDSDGLRRFAAGMKGRSESVAQIAISGDAAGATAASVASLILAKLNGVSLEGLRPVAVTGQNGFGFGLAADWGESGGKRLFMDYYSGGAATKAVFGYSAETKKWSVAFAGK